MRRQEHTKKARLSIDCTLEERRYIKMLAAREDKTISEYLLSLARARMPTCTLSHTPNDETIAAIEDSEKGNGIEKFESLEEFWKSMGA
jgi:hypothetical protein